MVDGDGMTFSLVRRSVIAQFGLSAFPKELAQQYKAWGTLSYSLSLMGMDPGDPPNVAGFPRF